MTLFDMIGLIGVAAYTFAYALLQLNRLRSDESLYLVLNGLGSCFIIISLLASFNLPSFIAQVLWLAFTVVGFFRARSARRPPSV